MFARALLRGRVEQGIENDTEKGHTLASLLTRLILAHSGRPNASNLGSPRALCPHLAFFVNFDGAVLIIALLPVSSSSSSSWLAPPPPERTRVFSGGPHRPSPRLDAARETCARGPREVPRGGPIREAGRKWGEGEGTDGRGKG